MEDIYTGFGVSFMTLGFQPPGEAYFPVDVGKTLDGEHKKDVFAVLITNDAGVPLFRSLVRGEYNGVEELEAGMWNALQSFIREAKEDELESCRTKSGRCIVHNEALGTTSSKEPYKITSALEVRTSARVEDVVESTMRAFNEQVLMSFIELYEDTLTRPVELTQYHEFRHQVTGLFERYQKQLQKAYNQRMYSKLAELDKPGMPIALRAEIKGLGYIVDDLKLEEGRNLFVDAVRDMLESCPPLVQYVKPIAYSEQLDEIFEVDRLKPLELERADTQLEILSGLTGEKYGTITEWSNGLRAYFASALSDLVGGLQPPTSKDAYPHYRLRQDLAKTFMSGTPQSLAAEESIRMLVASCNGVEQANWVNYMHLHFKEVAPRLGVPLIRPINDPRVTGVPYK